MEKPADMVAPVHITPNTPDINRNKDHTPGMRESFMHYGR